MLEVRPTTRTGRVATVLPWVDPFPDIPDALKKQRRWCLWDSNSDLPKQLNGRKARSNGPDTWSSYQDTCNALGDGQFPTIAVTPELGTLVGDLDGCFDENGELKPWAQPAVVMLREAGTYMEFSKSGRGLHAFILGKLNTDKAKIFWAIGEHEGIELFQGPQPIATTGQRYGDAPSVIRPCPEIIALVTERAGQAKPRAKSNVKSNGNGDRRIHEGQRSTYLTSLGGTLRRQGLREDAILITLCKVNETRCIPPLPDDEVHRIAHSVAKYPPAQPGTFQVTDEGVFCQVLRPATKTQPEAWVSVRLSARIDIMGRTRDAAGENWGLLLRWEDSENRQHSWTMPMSLLASQTNEVWSHLLSGGLTYLATAPALRGKLAEYLQTTPVDKMVRCVNRIGWHAKTFVLPDTAIGPEGAEDVLYQTPLDAAHHWNAQGTAAEWREHVGKRCGGNSRLILAVSAGFAGPLIRLIGAESIGIHLHGLTSTGKSTALMVGGSVCGGGGQAGFCQTWRATANGLEAVAELHNDATLFLDELSQVDPREAAEVAYLLANGLGKLRMTRTIGVRKKLTWSLGYVSAGELTLAEHVASTAKRTRGGAEIRLLNIDADAGAGTGLFENLHGTATPDAFAREMKEAALRYYGAPLREYLKRLVREPEAAIAYVRDERKGFLEDCVPKDAPGEVRRAAERFALIFAAGKLATFYGLTGWEAEEATDVMDRVFTEWLKNRGGKGATDADDGIRAVRSFIQIHGASRFETIPLPEKRVPVRDRAGFIRMDEETWQEPEEYLFFPETFKHEVCKGLSWRGVLKVLATHGYLRRQGDDMTIKTTLPGFEKSQRVYCVLPKILEGDE